MTDAVTPDSIPSRAVVQFNCTGRAVGKMRNELAVEMVQPMHESFELATDEGPFHGGDATAPPPLAMADNLRRYLARRDVTCDVLALADLTALMIGCRADLPALEAMRQLS